MLQSVGNIGLSLVFLNKEGESDVHSLLVLYHAHKDGAHSAVHISAAKQGFDTEIESMPSSNTNHSICSHGAHM
jgi:hypothetical protein